MDDDEASTATGRYGDDDSAAFRGAHFHGVDLTGARFRDCTFRDVSIVSAVLGNLRVDGFGGRTGRVIVDDVDVTPYVEDELDRRHPERVQVRAAQTADHIRAAWSLLEGLWDGTIERAERLPDQARDERVDDEWSVAETLRHLVFAIDVWVGRMLLGSSGFHPLGLPTTDYPADRLAELGVDVDARPAWSDVSAAFAQHRDWAASVVRAVRDDELDVVRTGVPAPAWGEESYPVRSCLRVLLNEVCEHRRFVERDLGRLEGRPAAGGTVGP